MLTPQIILPSMYPHRQDSLCAQHFHQQSQSVQVKPVQSELTSTIQVLFVFMATFENLVVYYSFIIFIALQRGV